jgi:Na+-translocating ferredoxin:NAD+ oxidoreductase subunit G
MKEIFRYGLVLTIVCLAAGGMLAGVNRLTNPRILIQAEEERNDSLKEVLSLADSFEAVKEGDATLYYKAYDKDKNLIGVAFMASAKGYSSTIETMVGMLKDGTINAIKILQQNETPGLGTRIQEVKDDTTIFDALCGKNSIASKIPWFQQQFTAKKFAELDQVDGITGATISSKAVIKSVKEKTEEIMKLLQDKKI